MSVREPSSAPNPVLLTVKQFAQKHPFVSEGSLRWMLFHRDKNGLAKCIHKLGRKVLIDEDGFFQWQENQGDAPLDGRKAVANGRPATAN